MKPVVFVLVAALAAVVPTTASGAQDPPPRVLLDQPARIVEYQLNRLSTEQLLRVERRTDDAKYRPVYLAVLTRAGVAASERGEAVAALMALGKTTAAEVLVEALARVPADDVATADQLVRLLLAQPADVLGQQRELFARTTEQAPPDSHGIRAAYGAMLVADADPTAAWTSALGRPGHSRELLRSVPNLPAGARTDALGARLAPLIVSRLSESALDAPTRAAAITALAAVRRDDVAFSILAREWRAATAAGVRAAATGALLLIPEPAWPVAEVEVLSQAILAYLEATAPADRSEVLALDVIQLGERLTARMPDDRARAVRGALRSLGVQVVRIEALFEQVSFDVRWFAVEAGKPVQIVLANPDAMPHNLVVGRPGSLESIGTAAGTMATPTDPAVKPFVPDSPLVLYATNLLKQGETERLGFVAPTEPGEYVFACTFPGHWVRMYGVMLVVPDLAVWEKAPTVPIDPLTKRPFASRRN